MARDVDIDSIVREVLARLRNDDAPRTNAAGSPGLGVPGDRAARAEQAADQLELTDRLVTLATLKHRLEGIRHVVLPRGAVVTPAARDELRDRDIRTSCAPVAALAAATLVVGIAALDVARGSFDRAAFVDALSREGLALERVADTGLKSVVAELADHVARGGRPALLLTGEPEAAACLANRISGVRAVAGREANSLRQAIRSTGANFVAVDPVPAPQSARRLVHEFCLEWPRPVPAVLSTHSQRASA